MSMEIIDNFTRRERFQWTAAANKWADDVGPLIRARMKEEAPVGEGPRRGRMRDSIRYERRNDSGDVSLMFNAYTPYAKYVVDGTRAHEIYPKAARYLHFFDKRFGAPVERFVGPRGTPAHVNHPGTRANHFPERAMESVRQDVQDRFVEIMSEAMGGRK